MTHFVVDNTEIPSPRVNERPIIWEARALVSPPATSPQITYTAVGSPAHVQVTIFAFRGCALASTTGWTGK